MLIKKSGIVWYDAPGGKRENEKWMSTENFDYFKMHK
jgi:hypothetical protein